MPSFLGRPCLCPRILFSVLFVLGLGVPPAFPQKGPASIRVTPELRQFVRASGYIFVGEVVRIDPPESPAGTLQITFHVDQAIRGVRAGQTLTLREWAGRWREGEHYQVGERLAVFFYPPSRAGLTSPVQGAEGKFRLDQHGNLIIDDERSRLFAPSRRPSPGQTQVSIAEFTRAIRRAAEE